ncbi:glycosyltransferase family 4 protein [Candidatus Lokiarchaeum ossiferum]|uniref:glycosyltransferase family 4 protein n=1 Tax=Candidatus Lokiarchaeum ossiferum TaxID=2951803 RepID=UPI00352F271A
MFKIPNLLYSVFLLFFNWDLFQKCDIIKTNQMRGAWSLFFMKLLNKKLILRTGYTWSLFLKKEIHQNKPLIFVVRLIERILYKLVNYSFVTSKEDKKYVKSSYLKNSNNQITLISNYIDTDLFKPLINGRKDELIYIGRLSPEKNLINLLKAVEKTRLCLTIVGDGILYEDLLNFSVNRNLSVSFIKHIANEELPLKLNCFKYFILPSYHEGMPKVLLEAMSCGLCCFATNVSGSRELIENMKTGILIPDCSSLSISKSLSLIKKKQLPLEEISKQSRKYILENCSLKYTINKELNIYRSFFVD